MDRNIRVRACEIQLLVALLAEGVDRNQLGFLEITVDFVALLAEGVDRNFLVNAQIFGPFGRPPRGGRG